MYTKIIKLFDAKLNLRTAEKFNIYLLQGSIFLIIMVLLILKSVFTSMMLSEYGISVMPKAFIIIAGVAVIVQLLFHNFVNPEKHFVNLLINNAFHILILGTISLVLFYEVKPPGWTLFLYVYVSLFSLISVTLFYQYIQSLFTIREAKKVYAYIGSAAIAGGISGGYMTSVLVDQIGHVGLVLFTAILIALCSLLLVLFSRRHKKGWSTKNPNASTLASDLKQEVTFRGIFKNKHIRYITIIIGSGVLVSKLVDFQFNYMLMTKVDNANDMTSFLGFWYSNINVIGFLIQVFFTKYIIDRFGVHNSMAAFPVAIFLGSSALLLFPVLGIAILVKALDGSLKQSIYKTTTEINIMPLSVNLRNRAKTFIDVVVDSVATGVAGLFILVYNGYISLDLTYITYCIIALSIIWIIAILKSKITYKKALAQKLIKNNNSNLDTSILIEDPIFTDEIAALNIDTLDDILEVKAFLKDSRPIVRAFALERLIELVKSSCLPQLIIATKDADINVQRVAFYGLVQFANLEEDLDELYIYTDIKGRILLTESIVVSLDKSIKSYRFYNIYDRIKEEFAELTFLSLESKEDLNLYYGIIYKAILLTKDVDNYDIIDEVLADSSHPSLQREALKAIRLSKNKVFLPKLLTVEIAESNTQEFHQALAAFPSLIFKLLKEYSKKEDRLIEVLSPSLLFIESQRAVNLLTNLIFISDTNMKKVLIKVLNLYRTKYPDLNFKNLKSSVKIRREVAAISAMIQECRLTISDERAGYSANKIKELEYQTDKIKMKASVTNLMIYLNVHYRDTTIFDNQNNLFSSKRNTIFDYLDSILAYRSKKKIIPILEEAVNIIGIED